MKSFFKITISEKEPFLPFSFFIEKNTISGPAFYIFLIVAAFHILLYFHVTHMLVVTIFISQHRFTSQIIFKSQREKEH